MSYLLHLATLSLTRDLVWVLLIVGLLSSFVGLVCGFFLSVTLLDRRGWLRTPRERSSILVRRMP